MKIELNIPPHKSELANLLEIGGVRVHRSEVISLQLTIDVNPDYDNGVFKLRTTLCKYEIVYKGYHDKDAPEASTLLRHGFFADNEQETQISKLFKNVFVGSNDVVINKFLYSNGFHLVNDFLYLIDVENQSIELI